MEAIYTRVKIQVSLITCTHGQTEGDLGHGKKLSLCPLPPFVA